MLEQMVREAVERLLNVKWTLVAMATCCFLFSAYVFMTPPQGGLGLLMITPTEGPAGLVGVLPWAALAFGAVTCVTPFISRAGWVLGRVEPLLGAAMLLAGLWGLFFGFGADSALACGVAGIVLAFYVLFIGLDMMRRREGRWYIEIAVAAVVWVASFYVLMGLAGTGAWTPAMALALFVAAWGFVYGAVALDGVRDQALAA